jgi:hypothetical protein
VRPRLEEGEGEGEGWKSSNEKPPAPPALGEISIAGDFHGAN